jgi:uncharacterized protein
MRIVVSGGSGFLGSALVDRLRQEHEVTVLTRRPRTAGDAAWSPDEPAGAWARAVAAADAVINLAGESLADGRWTAERKEAIRHSRVAATRAIVGVIRRASTAPLLLSASAIGIYGPRGDEALTEDTPPGSDFLASVCKEWEAEAQQAGDATRVVLLRTGLVLAADGGALPQLALPFKLFAGGPLGSGRQYWSWIHRDDWVEMVRWAILTEALRGPLNLTAPQPETNAQFARTLGEVLRRPSLVPTPAFALRLALGEMADAAILSGQRVLPARAQALGYAFRYPTLRAALDAIYGRA